MTLPVAAEVDRRAAAHDQAHHRADLLAGAVPAMIFAPRQFPRIPDQVDPGDVMIVTDLAAPRAGEEGLGLVGAGLIVGILDRVVDPLGLEAGMQRVPGRGFVGMDRRGPVHARLDEVQRRVLALKHRRQRTAQAGAGQRAFPDTMTTLRLALRFSVSRRSLRSALRFSGRTWPPK